MNAGLLRASALRCGEHRQRRLPGKKQSPHKNSANLDLAKVRLPKGSVSYTPHIRPACLPARMAEDVDSEVINL